MPTQPEWAGQWITCPACNGSLYAPFPGDKPSVPTSLPAQAGPTRLCALCAETIPVIDVRCHYCGGDPTGARPAPPAPRPAPAETDGGGVHVLVVGLLGLMFCQLLAPVAWILGANYVSDCRRRGVTPGGPGYAGKILGIVGTLMIGLFIAFYVVVGLAQCL